MPVPRWPLIGQSVSSLKKKMFGEPSRGSFFITGICSAAAVQHTVCKGVDKAGPSLVWD